MVRNCIRYCLCFNSLIFFFFLLFILSELIAYTYHHLYGLSTTGLRFFTVYGPRGRPDMAPFKFIERVYNGDMIQQYGDGSTSRDYTYIDDIVQGVVAAIDRPLGYEVINLGNGRPYLLKDFIHLVETSVGKKANIEVLPEQPGDVERTCADISKAKRLLGYNPKITFEEGIARTVEWYQMARYQVLTEKVIDIKRMITPDPSRKKSFDEMSAMSETRFSFTHEGQEDDLELDSNVQKADHQYKVRRARYLSF
jgi:hypothetical protein